MKSKSLKEHSIYPHVNTIILILFSGYVMTWYLQLGNRKPWLGEIRFEFYYAILLSIITLFLARRRDFDCPLFLYILLYLLALVVQIPFSYDYDRSWDIFLNRIVKFSFMCWFIVFFVRNPRSLMFFLCAFFLACMKMGQEGFVGNLTGSLLWENQGILRLHGTTPLYAHPNSFAGNAIGTLPFIIYLFARSHWSVKIGMIIQAVFALNIIVYSGSRTSYVALFIFMLVLLYKIRVNKKKMFIVILFIALGVLIFNRIIPEQYLQRFESIITLEEVEGSSSDKRIQILKDGWQIFVSHPFGVGISAFMAVRKDTFGRLQDTHNLYLEIATNLGIQGLFIFFLLIYNMLKILTKLADNISLQEKKITAKIQSGGISDYIKIRMEKQIGVLWFLKSTCNAVFLFIIVRLSLGLFGMDLYEIYWWFASGLTISLFNIERYSKIKTNELLNCNLKGGNEQGLLKRD